MLKGKKILLGVTGSIAAYKSPDLVRRLMEEGATVRVVMTPSAARFVTPLTFEAVSGNPCLSDQFSDPFSHIELAKSADLFIIAPATANTINKIHNGIADNLLTNLWLTYRGPVLVAPAMNVRMYRHRSVRNSISALAKEGVEFVGPESGKLACGDEGEGRMSDVGSIVETALRMLSNHDLESKKILVTAGPTREAIDPVRFISNRSSGKMGYSIAREAVRRGAAVRLISGPTQEKPPLGARVIHVDDASSMQKAVISHLKWSNVLIMAAAVADFRPAVSYKKKHEKNSYNTLKLKKNDDILVRASRDKGRRLFIGFAAESGMNRKNALEKLDKKRLDYIVLNDISRPDAGFESDTNAVSILGRDGFEADYPLMSKRDVANLVLDLLKRH